MSSKKLLFESLHTDFKPMVINMCTGFVNGDRDLAKDLSQDVFINIWNALDRFKGASGYKTWIYRITVNTCLNYIRSRKNKTNLPIDELKDHFPYQEPNRHESLYEAIGRLNEIDRLILMMILDEVEYSEIAEIMGISEGNLRVKIYRIKKNLKNIIENE